MNLPCDFMGRSPSKQVTIMQCLVAAVTLVGEFFNLSVEFSLSRGLASPSDKMVIGFYE